MGEEVFGQLRQVVAGQFGFDPSKVTLATSFVTDLGADSLDTIELIMAIERAFDVAIPEAKAESMGTVQDVMNYIELKRVRRQHSRER